MIKKYLKKKNISDIFFYPLVIIIIVFINKTNRVYGANNNWVEISKTPTGIQYIDSVNKKNKGVIEISTKYLRINANTSEIEEKIYSMRIDCLTNQFKDVSVNGKKNLEAKWEDPNEDKLINDVISYSCKNV